MSYARGLGAEALAATFLVERGLSLLSRNYRCRHGEIDLIARDGATLCFVEVRSRRVASFGAPIDTVNASKRRRILKTAAHFLAYAFHSPPCACRFDIVSIQGEDSLSIDWQRGAFEADADFVDPATS